MVERWVSVVTEICQLEELMSLVNNKYTEYAATWSMWSQYIENRK